MAAPPTYPLAIRVAHWVNVLALVALVGSGLQIFHAHPALYAADDSDARRLVFSLAEVPAQLRLGGWLEGGRKIHLALAWVFLLNGALYLGAMLHRRRDRLVWPRRADLQAIPAAIRDHLRWPPRLEGAAGGLNPLQKVAYFGVVAFLGPFVVATGLALSPTWDAIVPWWTDMLGGRQFARTWHFVAMVALLGFGAVHLVMVALAGPVAWMKMLGGRRG